MSTENRTICDGCKEVKGDANRWWEISESLGSGLLITPAGVAGDHPHEDYCGEKCALERVQKFFASHRPTSAEEKENA